MWTDSYSMQLYCLNGALEEKILVYGARNQPVILLHTAQLMVIDLNGKLFHMWYILCDCCLQTIIFFFCQCPICRAWNMLTTFSAEGVK